MSRFLVGLVAGIALLVPATVFSAGEHQRRFAVELALLAGDSRLLVEENLPAEKRQWVEGRVTSSLNILPLLARYYQQESGLDEDSPLDQVKDLQRLSIGSDALFKAAGEMSQRFPIRFSVDLKQPLDALIKSEVVSAYQQMCLGCHIAPAPDASVVIGNFGAFARSIPDDEWLARLLGGLRGDSYTTYENPFSDAEISGFYRYIRDELP